MHIYFSPTCVKLSFSTLLNCTFPFESIKIKRDLEEYLLIKLPDFQNRFLGEDAISLGIKEISNGAQLDEDGF